MYPFSEMQSSATTLFSAYAQFAAAMMLIRSVANELIPYSFQPYIHRLINYLFTPLSNYQTIVIDDVVGMNRNQVFESSEIYLSTKIPPTTERFKVNKIPKQKTIGISMEKNQEIIDVYKENIILKWRFIFNEARYDQIHSPEKKMFELTFKKKYKDTVLNDYLPFILEKAQEIKAEERTVKLYTRDCPYFEEDYSNGGGGGGGAGVWGSINLDHPATFDTLAMDSKLKKDIIDDLDRFIKRKDYYKKVGKAWKRGYLLYGPPGTGKSSLVAAMANYLKFDIYDLELTSLYSNSELRRILVSTTNRSILVIEDIDCSVEMLDRNLGHNYQNGNFGQDSSNKLTLSGLLNFIDGLWSSCGDERIIIFTTNYKEKLDPALLRPGRMDMHIHLSYCKSHGFKTLVSNYLDIKNVEEHRFYSQIETLIDKIDVTPAEIAEELMRIEDHDHAIERVVDFLKNKKFEAEEIKKDEKKLQVQNLQENGGKMDNLKKSDDEEEEEDDDVETQQTRRLKSDRMVRRPFRNRVFYGRGRGGFSFRNVNRY